MADHEKGGVSGQETPSRSGGRPEYKPTADQRRLVRQLKAEGKPIGAIAQAVGVSRNTLRKHFAEELKAAAPAPVAQQLELGGVHHAVAAPVDSREPGRPEFEPTYRQREDVRLFKADDWSDDRIAQHLGISRTTLLKHFAEELEVGVHQVRATVLRNLMRESNNGSVTASDRILKLPGMVAPAERLPTPAEADLGKKERAARDALTAAEGTSWNDILTTH